MKRYGNLWASVVALDNIKLAHRQARRGKAHYSDVKMVDADVDKFAREIQTKLLDKSFTTSEYEIDERSDGRKTRVIHKLPYFPDRIVQHALLNVIGPLLVKSFIRDTFQSIKRRGTHDASRRVKKLVRAEDCPKYALKIDVRKYYPSVSNEYMKAALRRKIKDPDVLWLADDIIDSVEGLPIGNYTSQHFGNLFLTQFDWWMKQAVRPRGFFRYCDDILVFGDSTRELVKTKDRMVERLGEIGLDVKHNWNIYDVHKNGVDFVGFVFKPDQTRLRKCIANSFKTRCAKARRRRKRDDKTLSSLMAYKGWAKAGNGRKLWRAHTNQLTGLFPRQLRQCL